MFIVKRDSCVAYKLKNASRSVRVRSTNIAEFLSTLTFLIWLK